MIDYALQNELRKRVCVRTKCPCNCNAKLVPFNRDARGTLMLLWECTKCGILFCSYLGTTISIHPSKRNESYEDFVGRTLREG